MDLDQGSHVGPYEIVRALGSGGMGTVYLARDSRLRRLVALKSLRADLVSESSRKRLLQEAQAVALTNHPNIAGIYDVVEDGDDIFIVMEYVAGETLRERLLGGPVPLVELAAVADQLARALQHAHEHGVVHRDLKPANVVLGRDGQVKILDFGLAKLTPVEVSGTVELLDPSFSALTAAGTVVGTPGYIAPEVLLGEPASERSDIYSLAVVLFEMATGRRPFTGVNFVALARSTLVDDPPDPTELRPELPPSLGQLILGSLARDPGERPPSVAALRQELEAIAMPTGEEPTLPSIPEVAAPRRSSRWLVSGVAGLGALALLLLFGRGAPEPRPVAPEAGSVAGDGPRVVAVLPFENLTGDDGKAYLAVGLTETLAADLAAHRELTVLSPLSSAGRVGAGSEPAPTRTGGLGATDLVGGHVQTQGSSVRVSVRLSDRAGGLVWASSYERELDEFLDLEAAVSADLERALLPELAAEAPRQERPSEDPTALAAYWQGRALLLRRDVPGALGEAVERFREALERDERFGLAAAGLGQALWLLYDQTQDPSVASEAVAQGERARTLDPASPEVRFALGMSYHRVGRDDEAMAELTKAIELRSRYVEAHEELGLVHAARGRIDDAVAELEAAIAIRPDHWGTYSLLGRIELGAGRHAEAIESFRRVVELAPDSSAGYQQLGTALHATGALDEALEQYRRATEISPNAPAYSNMGTILYQRGRFADAAAAYREAIELRPLAAATHRNLGDALERLGDEAGARAAWERAASLVEERLTVNPSDPLILAQLAVYRAKLGDRVAAIGYATQAESAAPNEPEVLYRVAVVHALGGRSTEALAALERSLEAGYSLSLAREDDDLASLSASPRFRELVGGGGPDPG